MGQCRGLGSRVIRGDVWLAQVGRKRRPVLVLTRPEVMDVRTSVTVAEITTTIRGLSVEVAFDHSSIGLDRACVINCDGLHTVNQSLLNEFVGAVDEATLRRVCAAVAVALGC